MSKLSEREKRFCEEFVVDLNATQAYIRAGYKPKAARACSSRLLAKANIQDHIQSLRLEQQKRTEITADSVLRDIEAVKNRCMQSEPAMRFDKCVGGMVQKVDSQGNELFEFDANGALKALDMLGRHIGFYEKDNEQGSTVPSFTVVLSKDED